MEGREPNEIRVYAPAARQPHISSRKQGESRNKKAVACERRDRDAHLPSPAGRCYATRPPNLPSAHASPRPLENGNERAARLTVTGSAAPAPAQRDRPVSHPRGPGRADAVMP